MIPETIKTRGRHAAIRFAPAAPLDKHHKQKFQVKSNEGFDWRRQEYNETAWQLVSPQAEGDPRSQLKFTLGPDMLNFEDFFPVGPLELFCDNLRLAMECVADVFNPRLIVGSGVVVRFTAQSAGDDARVYLGHRCLQLENRLSKLGRPVHAVGLKMLLPPLPGEAGPNWQADVKIESLIEDVRQLFIEVDARWAHPVPWDMQAIIDRVRTAHDFATNQVVAVLKELGGNAG
jgi:hypothetical protein